MKHLVFAFFLVFIIVGCGDKAEEPITEVNDPLAQKNSPAIIKENIKSNCTQPITANFKQSSNGNDLMLRFQGINQKKDHINTPPEMKKCSEIDHSFSAGLLMENNKLISSDLRLELEFKPTDIQKEELESGLLINLQPKISKINFMDGAKNERVAYNFDLSCKNNFVIKCNIIDAGHGKKCSSYDINLPQQSCTIKIENLSFNFSDNTETKLELAGEIKFSGLKTAELEISSVTWPLK